MASTPLARERTVLDRPQELLSNRLQTWIRHNTELVATLPPHPAVWRGSKFEVVEVVRGPATEEDVVGNNLTHEERTRLPDEILQRVGVALVESSSDYHKRVKLYQTKKGVRAYADAILADRDLLPCGHSGFSNLGDGEFACGFEDCEARYERATIEEVFC